MSLKLDYVFFRRQLFILSQRHFTLRADHEGLSKRVLANQNQEGTPERLNRFFIITWARLPSFFTHLVMSSSYFSSEQECSWISAGRRGSGCHSFSQLVPETSASIVWRCSRGRSIATVHRAGGHRGHPVVGWHTIRRLNRVVTPYVTHSSTSASLWIKAKSISSLEIFSSIFCYDFGLRFKNNSRIYCPGMEQSLSYKEPEYRELGISY